MITVIIIGLIAVTFAFMAQLKKLRFCLVLSFLVIFLFLALRYNYSPDYMGYLQLFTDINQSSLDFDDFKNIWLKSMLANMIFGDSDELQMNVLTTEPGWLTLCLLFKPFGFFAMVAFLALFNCIVYYWFIKKYVPPTYYWLAVFLYVFSPNLMLVQSSAMRQSVAIAIFVIATNFIYKKNFFCYALLIIAATLFHTTAIILLPVYLLGVINTKIDRLKISLIFLIFVGLFFLRDPLSQVIDVLVSTYVPKYEFYSESDKIGSGLGIVFSAFILLITLMYDKYQDNDISLQFRISILGIFVIPFSLIIMLLTRFHFYFLPMTLVVYPYVSIKTNKIFSNNHLLFQSIFLLSVIAWTLFLFWGFFQSPAWKTHFGTYNTIFSSPSWH